MTLKRKVLKFELITYLNMLTEHPSSKLVNMCFLYQPKKNKNKNNCIII